MVPAPARPLPRGFDGPIHIGHEQTCSQPSTVRDMLTLLDVRTGQHVLDIGSGSGWTTALLAALVGLTGRVRGVEIMPEPVEQGATNLAQAPCTWASIEQARPHAVGLGKHAPYDRFGRCGDDLVEDAVVAAA